MQNKSWGFKLSMVASAIILTVGGYLAGQHAAPASQNAAPTQISAANAGKKVLYWHDPMVPQQHFDKPGKSPFMNMALVPVYADSDQQPGLKVDPAMQQDLGIRFATVRQTEVHSQLSVIGTTQFDESLAEVIQTRATGYITHLYANAPQQRLKRGEPVASLFVPEWLPAQEEYLALKHSHLDATMLNDAKAKMRALSIPEAFISTLDKTGKVQNNLLITAPRDGVVSELDVRDGAMVAPGQTLAKINGLGKLWLVVDIPETLADQVQVGMQVTASPSNQPNRTIHGEIQQILPQINGSSRTLQARLVIDNANDEWVPGMLMRVQLSSSVGKPGLLVPSEAIIATGKRTVVIVRNQDGRLQPANVVVGREIGDDTEVLSGLQTGEQVVASGQFLIDSEANLKSVLPRIDGAEAMASHATTGSDASTANAMPMAANQTTAPANSAALTQYQSTGVIEQVTPEDITLSHQPVPALQWPAMTMAYKKPAAANSAANVAKFKAGDKVNFSFQQDGDGWQLTGMTAANGGQP
ncbi:efflux RND transporter periplasmic adaptor subunit [Rouxiella sp. Mn2063]|uniref:efflux RND transporter periplasmic adaptor subunit n=1 Tax=Rouxiella sp. Mn2063 TaxID=3395262 RepID=UPI003BC1AEA6